MFLALAAIPPLLARVLSLFGGEDPVKGEPWYHERLSRDAAATAGWTTPAPGDDGSAADALAWHADYVDSYLYNPAWWAAGGLGRFKAALLAHDELVKVHFDDLGSTVQITRMWQRYLGGTVAGLRWAAERVPGGDVDAARHVVGVSLHAAQDFYSHSNWLDAPERRTRTWFDLARERGTAQRAALHLYTGTYELPDHLGHKPHGTLAFDCFILRQLVGPTIMDVLCAGISPLSGTGLCERWRECASSAVPARPRTVLGVPLPENIVWIEPPGIALDSTWMSAISVQQRDLPDEVSSDTLFRQALALAERHSTQWLLQLEQIMGQAGLADFWHRVKTERRNGERRVPDIDPIKSYLGGYRGDLDEFEKPGALGVTFLSAGTYPPPDDAPEGWYLRLELTTATTFGAGTNADIHAEVDGHEFLLDHMHGRTPEGGLDQWRILEFNDFEAGDHTAYVVGPLTSRPSALALRNAGAGALDVLAGAWEDLKHTATRILETIESLLLSLIGGHADFVGADKRTYSWADLVAIATTGSQTFRMYCDGGGEGNYRVEGVVTSVLTDAGASASVRLTKLICVRESSWDRGSSSDEPFVQFLVSSPANGQVIGRREGPFSGVDSGEVRTITGVSVTVSVPRYGGLIVPLQVWESDDEGSGGRDDLLAQFRSRYGDAITNERSQFLDAVGAAIAPDWRLAKVDAFAFRRGDTVETARLVRDRVVNRWVDAGTRLHVPLDATPTSALPATLASPPYIADGTLVHDTTFRAIWVVYGGARFHVPDPATLQRLYPGRGWRDLDAARVAVLPQVPVDGTMLHEETGAVWIVYGGARFHVPDPQTMGRLYSWDRIRPLWTGALAGIGTVPADGTLLQEESGAVFVIHGGAYFGVPSADAFNRIFAGRTPCQLWNGALGHLRHIPADGTLLREESGAIFVIYGGAYFGVPNMGVYHQLFPERAPGQLWNGALGHLRSVPTDGTLLREGPNAPVFVVSGGRKVNAPPGAQGPVHLLWPGALAHLPSG